ncbi:MAG: hypothetical protein HOV79_26710 [Hamadaea sp.]|nr:hypothetical protein [Hamadaea sp.]
MRTVRAGLVLAVLLGLGDLALPLGGGDFPPIAVALIGAALGLITLVAAVPGWKGNRVALLTVAVTRVISALTALPAFVVADVPAEAQIAAGAIVVLTLVVVGLLTPGLRRPVLSS